MGWSVSLTSKVFLQAPEKVELDPGDVNCITAEMKGRMVTAVTQARGMVLTAYYSITRYNNSSEVKETLNKYFNLASDDENYGRICNRIAQVYSRVMRGMDCGYSIRVFGPAASFGGKRLDNTRGFVPGNLAHGRKALGQFFLKADDNGHIDWDAMQRMAYSGSAVDASKRDIHLSLSVISGEEAEAIARTLVHESTHKWANTDDVCYKHSTASKLLANDEETLATLVRQGFGYGESLKDNPNKIRVKFVKMQPSGRGPAKIPSYPKNKFVAQNETWINNADSYAWAARRLWKKCEAVVGVIDAQ